MSKLTVIQISKAKPGRHADGKGLYLLVKPSGAKSWVLRIQVNGRRRDFGLGSADLVSLSDARDKAMEGRKLARNGLNPAMEWKKAREVMPTFEEAARRYHKHVMQGWKNGKHRDQWLSTLKTHAFQTIGDRQVTEIDAAAIQSVLLPIWLKLPETARRVRQRIGAVLDYAHGQGWRAIEAPMRAVAKGLPRQPRKAGHFAAMPYQALPQLMAKLRAADISIGRLALQFAILTAARSGEVRGATWEEIDWEGKQWNIPAERMKTGEPHSIPLSAAAVAVLEEARKLGSRSQKVPIFPGMRGGPLSDMTLTKVLRTADGGHYTVHGMRSAFRDWAAERTRFPGEWAEAALAHTLANKVEAAYRRTKFLDQRRGLMADWAEYLSDGDNVVSFARHSA